MREVKTDCQPLLNDLPLNFRQRNNTLIEVLRSLKIRAGLRE